MNLEAFKRLIHLPDTDVNEKNEWGLVDYLMESEVWDFTRELLKRTEPYIFNSLYHCPGGCIQSGTGNKYIVQVLSV